MDGKQLKDSILQWMIQGNLVEQNPNDEPANELLERIALARNEKKQSTSKGKKKNTTAVSRIFQEQDAWYELVGSGEPKNITEEIPFQIPNGWSWCRLRDVIWHLSDGTHQTPKYTTSGVPFISVKNMSSGKLSFSDTKFVSKSDSDLLNQRCNPEKGDLLLSKVGTTGVPVIVDVDIQFSLFVSLALVKFFPEYLDSQFFVYLIQSPLVQGQVRENTRGVGNKNWVLKDISRTLLALPPLAEQKRIVEKLNQILPLVEEYGAAQKQLDELNMTLPKNLKRSILQEAVQGKLVSHLESDGNSEKLVERIVKEKNELEKKIPKKRKDPPCKDISDDEIPFPIPETWRWLRLSSMAVMYTGNSINETEKLAKYTNVEGMEYIGTKDVGFDHKVNYKNGVAIPAKYIQDFKIAPANSVLLCIEGGSAGRKICEINQDVCFGNKLCCFTTSKDCVKYLYYYLQSPLFFDVFRDNKTGIIGGVSVNTLKELLVPIPPLAEQKRIVKKIEELFKAIDSMNLK